MQGRYSLEMAVANTMNLNRGCYLLLILAAIGSLFTSHPFIIWLLLANVLTLVIYGMDKMAARKAWRRVPEFTLLMFGVVGGWPGAIAGQQLFRHKTQKQPFKTYFIISVLLSISVMVAVYQLYPFRLSEHWLRANYTALQHLPDKVVEIVAGQLTFFR